MEALTEEVTEKHEKKKKPFWQKDDRGWKGRREAFYVAF